MSKRIEVNLDRQVLFAFDGASQVYCFDCVSGDEDHPTPTGHWSVIRKHAKYVSHKYHRRMDHAMFFTTTGEAIHEGIFVGLLSYLKYFGMPDIGSHGCVRLAQDDATALFDWTPIGTPVWVH
jgi:lipoprotein-anchoring transpeptidase ErfK/SrfK